MMNHNRSTCNCYNLRNTSHVAFKCGSHSRMVKRTSGIVSFATISRELVQGLMTSTQKFEIIGEDRTAGEIWGRSATYGMEVVTLWVYAKFIPNMDVTYIRVTSIGVYEGIKMMGAIFFLRVVVVFVKGGQKNSVKVTKIT